jgi:hypothetical protein
LRSSWLICGFSAFSFFLFFLVLVDDFSSVGSLPVFFDSLGLINLEIIKILWYLGLIPFYFSM